MHLVQFNPADKSIHVEDGTSLLDAVHMAGIELNTLCGGDGICGRCSMIIEKGVISDRISWPFTEGQIEEGYVLACLSHVYSDLVVRIPGYHHKAKNKFPGTGALSYSSSFQPGELDYKTLPVVQKIYIELEEPTIFTGQADHQLVSDTVKRRLNIPTMQMGLKIIELLPEVLRNSHYKITVTVGLRRDIAEIMDIEAGNCEDSNYMIIVDMGTTTVVAQLVNAHLRSTLDWAGCYNSQAIHGSEVTGRMIYAERKGIRSMQKLLVDDINKLIKTLCGRNNISPDSIMAVVCAGNTTIEHFLLGLSTCNIRRKPFIPVTVEPPPLRAGEVGLIVNRRGLLYSLPAISGWVGSDLTSGILATQMHRKTEMCLLIDIGTNGEVILGNREWLIAASASAGPALEGASVECGMRAEPGAVDKVYVESGSIKYRTLVNDHQQGIDICSCSSAQVLQSGFIIDDNPGISWSQIITEFPDQAVDITITAGPFTLSHGNEVISFIFSDYLMKSRFYVIGLSHTGWKIFNSLEHLLPDCLNITGSQQSSQIAVGIRIDSQNRFMPTGAKSRDQ